MALSRSILKNFAKVTNDRATKTNTNTYAYGTAVIGDDGSKYVKMDGSNQVTPVSRLTDIEDGDRVMVSIQDHRAVVMGNLTYPPSARVANSALAAGNQALLEVDTVRANMITTDTLIAEVIKAGYITADQIDASYAKITELDAKYAKIETLEADYIKTEKLEAEIANIGYLTAEQIEVQYVKTEKLEADYAKIDYLNANYITTAELNAGYAKITDLEATNADIDVLDANYANIETLLSGNVSSGSIQSIVLNSSNATIANGTIKSAMIESLTFDKITGFDINTTNLTIHSNDGKSKWSDNTIQISDANRVRVQIGKDASNDYSMSVWDANGKLIWDALGATENTIQRKIIRDAIVADDAAIAGSKLDIESVVSEINGATTKLKSTTILVDETNQTLDVSFKSLETTVANNLTEAKAYVDGKIDGLEIGGRNLIRNSEHLMFEDYYFENTNQIDVTYDEFGNVNITGITASHDNNGNVTLNNVTVTYDQNGNITLS